MTNDDIVTRLRRISTIFDCEVAADEIERLRRKLLAEENAYDILRLENERLRKEAFALSAWACREIDRITDERDESRQRMNSILTEIDCRIEHGAESNGHLEAIYNLFKDATDERHR